MGLRDLGIDDFIGNIGKMDFNINELARDDLAQIAKREGVNLAFSEEMKRVLRTKGPGGVKSFLCPHLDGETSQGPSSDEQAYPFLDGSTVKEVSSYGFSNTVHSLKNVTDQSRTSKSFKLPLKTPWVNVGGTITIAKNQLISAVADISFRQQGRIVTYQYNWYCRYRNKYRHWVREYEPKARQVKVLIVDR